MLRFQGPKASDQLRRRWQRIYQHQAARYLHHGEPDWHGHVIDALELFKAPYLAWDQFFNMGGALAIGIQRQQRPPRPALKLNLLASSSPIQTFTRPKDPQTYVVQGVGEFHYTEPYRRQPPETIVSNELWLSGVKIELSKGRAKPYGYKITSFATKDRA